VADEATRLLVDSYLKQPLVDGFLHADPHPGNPSWRMDELVEARLATP